MFANYDLSTVVSDKYDIAYVIYTVVHKNVRPNSCQLLIDLNNSFTATLCGQFAIKNIRSQSYLKRVATLPCETQML